jgi:hypothetical protein
MTRWVLGITHVILIRIFVKLFLQHILRPRLREDLKLL